MAVKTPASYPVYIHVVQVLRISLPLIASISVSLAYSLLDTVFVGRLEAGEIAALGAGTAVLSVLTQVIGALVTGYRITAARLFGKGDHEMLSRTTSTMLVIMLLAATLTTCMAWFASPLVRAISGDPEVQNLAIRYIRISSLGLLPAALTFMIRATFDAAGRTVWGLGATIISVCLNLTLDYLLIFGVGPFPALGLDGAAIGTAVGLIAGAIYIVGVYLVKSPLKAPTFSVDAVVGWNVLRISGPEVLNMFLDYGGNLVLFAIIGALGTIALGAGQISFLVVVAVFGLLLGLGIGLQIVLGQAIGRSEYEEYMSLIRAGMLVIGIAGAVLAIALGLGRDVLATLFTSQIDVAREAAAAMLPIALASPFIAWTVFSLAVLRAHGATGKVALINGVSVWFVQLPVSWILAVTLSMGVAGAFAGYIAYFLVRGAWSHLAIRQILTQQRDLMSGSPGP